MAVGAAEKPAPFPAPEPSELSARYWRALGEGKLTFQRCDSCANAWLPPRSECPQCLAADWRWETASGAAKLISWVVYHHGYHPFYAARLPYNVAVVELAEGPRLMSNILETERGLKIDMPLRLVIQREGDTALARFRPA